MKSIGSPSPHSIYGTEMPDIVVANDGSGSACTGVNTAKSVRAFIEKFL